jgi:hypothetical protein
MAEKSPATAREAPVAGNETPAPEAGNEAPAPEAVTEAQEKPKRCRPKKKAE